MQGPIQPPQPTPQFGQQTGPSFGFNGRGGREEDVNNMMEHLSFNQRVNQYAGGPLGPPPSDLVPVNSIVQDRARLQQQQQQSDMRGHQDAFLGNQGRNDRLQEFHELRGQPDTQAGRHGPEEPRPQPIGAQRHVEEIVTPQKAAPGSYARGKQENEPLSLSQQVQIAAASQQAAAEESAWAKKDAVMEPPPVSISPLPAPAAQRNGLHVADALDAESRSASQTPVETPSVSIAPWAERNAEHPKGPSLKEIQEAEARRAAEQEARK
jgi:PERQ amino acid-rich with GYF domain-containing protein